MSIFQGERYRTRSPSFRRVRDVFVSNPGLKNTKVGGSILNIRLAVPFSEAMICHLNSKPHDLAALVETDRST